uniref:Uncharacterized protein n=1 Tax=Alexandrium andersonii TaxID=327968 RepID=A0A7S2NHP1_9DINO
MEHAVKNPYAMALRKHREELDKYTVVPAVSDETLEMRLGIRREALCQLEEADDLLAEPSNLSVRPQAGLIWCRSEDAGIKPCVSSGPSVACCVEDGDRGEKPWASKVGAASGVYPLPIPGGSSSPTAAHSPLSARSFTSTTCSRPSVGDDQAAPGQDKGLGHQCSHARAEAHGHRPETVTPCARS